jgi:phage terminase large subunit GpA-like protein
MWSDLERSAWRLPELLTVSEWADKHRVLDPMISAEPGQWITERTPYLRGVMDAFVDPDVEEITLMMSAQVGKTESELNFIGYCIDQDPGPLLYVSTRADDAESVNVKRVQPMIRLSEALQGHMTGRDDHFKKKKSRSTA